MARNARNRNDRNRNRNQKDDTMNKQTQDGTTIDHDTQAPVIDGPQAGQGALEDKTKPQTEGGEGESTESTEGKKEKAKLTPDELAALEGELHALANKERTSGAVSIWWRIKAQRLIERVIAEADVSESRMALYAAADITASEYAKNAKVSALLAETGVMTLADTDASEPTPAMMAKLTNLPGFRVLQAISGKDVPEEVRAKVLAEPSTTYKATSDMIKAAKGTTTTTKATETDEEHDDRLFKRIADDMRSLKTAPARGRVLKEAADNAIGTCWETLGVLPTANVVVVKAAYVALKKLYANNPAQLAEVTSCYETAMKLIKDESR